MFYSFDNENFNYHGRWEATSDGMKSHWLRPYFEFYCDGNFSLSVADGSGEYSVEINGEKSETKDGVYRLTEKSLVRFTAHEMAKTAVFKGVETNGNIEKAPNRDRHILFIGDSLTHSPYSHSVVLPLEMDCDYTAVAQGGMSLMVGRGYLGLKDRDGFEGMQVAFFKLQNPCESDKPIDYDFSKAEAPDIIIVNIGTNDHLTDDDYAKDFITAYIEFIGKLRELYSEPPIFLALPCADTAGGYRRNTIEKVALKCEKLYKNVTYVSSREWPVEISDDNVHPTPQGYGVYAYELLNFLKSHHI